MNTAAALPSIAGIPIDFVLFAFTLAGVALFHKHVLKIAVSRIEPPPEEVLEKGGDYIRGVAKLDDRLIILVDLGRLLAHELTHVANRDVAVMTLAGFFAAIAAYIVQFGFFFGGSAGSWSRSLLVERKVKPNLERVFAMLSTKSSNTRSSNM